MIAVERAINAKEASDIREAMLVVAENPVKDKVSNKARSEQDKLGDRIQRDTRTIPPHQDAG